MSTSAPPRTTFAAITATIEAVSVPAALRSHALDPVEVAVALRSDPVAGLSEGEAAERLEREGPNVLAVPRRPPYVRMLLAQFVDPLVALLLVAAVVSAAIGEALDAVVIAAIVLLNAVLGFVLAVGAERGVLALHRSLPLRATVVRGGAEHKIDAAELVVGDVVRVVEGDRVPADARVVDTLGIEADESMLTGESIPVPKTVTPVPERTPLAERSCLLYAGTSVTRGSGTALVVATGGATEQGRIEGLVQKAEAPPTPLQQRIGRLARWLFALGVAVTLLLAGALLARGEPPREAFLVGVSVAVAAVPEGLVAILTVALALGSRAMARRRAIVRRLSAIETIGEATTICADKTGTLTENRLTLERVAPRSGAKEHDVLAAAALASAAAVDPVDRALLSAAAAAGVTSSRTVLRSVPFEASRKRSTVVAADPDGGLHSVVKGAPEVVLANSVSTARERARLEDIAAAWAAEGIRVLAVAERPVMSVDDGDIEASLLPIGLVGLADPLRATAAASVDAARALGLRVRILTGDHALTAAAIGRELDLAPEDIHARFTPADKLALVERLQHEGEVVAVTGDGVNDAPALRQADVGVAMGGAGAEAARIASTVVLSDDDFATIVAAIEEGRRVSANVRSFLAFLLSANLGEVVLFAAAVAAGVGVPMTVVQVLVVNLLTDGPPAIALAADKATLGRDWMRRGAPLLERGVLVGLLGIAALIGGCALGAYLVVREFHPEAAQTAAFAAIALAELLFVFSCRSPTLPSRRLGPNHWLNLAVLASLAILITILYLPTCQQAFDTVTLTGPELAVVAALASIPALAAELAKRVARRRRGR